LKVQKNPTSLFSSPLTQNHLNSLSRALSLALKKIQPPD
jgi:hypothetical protein